MINLRRKLDIYNPRTVFKARPYNPILADTLYPSFVTHLLEEGVTLRHNQILLGHSSSKTTERYTRVSVQEIGQIKNPIDDCYI